MRTQAPQAEAKQPPPPSPWTKETERKLRELWGKGLSLSGIAAEIGGINRNQVVGKVHRLKLDGRPSPLKPESRSWYRSAQGKAVAFDTKLYATRLAAVEEARIADERRLTDEADAEAAADLRSRAERETAERLEADRIASLFGPGEHKGATLAVGNLGKAQCRWPFGDPRDGDFCFCSGRARPGDVYCAEHARLAYVPSQMRGARAA